MTTTPDLFDSHANLECLRQGTTPKIPDQSRR